MSPEPVPTTGGPDVLPNPIPEPDPEPPQADPTPEPSPVPPVPEPAPAFSGTLFPYVRRGVSAFKKNFMNSQAAVLVSSFGNLCCRVTHFLGNPASSNWDSGRAPL
jgi:hypothetical protein